MKSYRKLIVWEKAMALVEAVYVVTKSLPARERFGLATQLQRAAVSIPANIAEGYGRLHRGDYLHHLSIARGSLFEIETLLTLTARLQFSAREQVLAPWNLSQECGRLLRALIAALRRKPPENPKEPSPRP
jgi:four helix bundle protein